MKLLLAVAVTIASHLALGRRTLISDRSGHGSLVGIGKFRRLMPYTLVTSTSPPTAQAPGRMSMRNITPWKLAAPSLFFIAWGGNHFTPLLPLYDEVAGLIPWQTNMLLGTYVFGLVPGLLVAAALSNVYGRKPLTLAGLIASALGNFLILLGSTSVAMLFTGRFFAGLAVGIGMSVGTSWIKELSSRQWDPLATTGAEGSDAVADV